MLISLKKKKPMATTGVCLRFLCCPPRALGIPGAVPPNRTVCLVATGGWCMPFLSSPALGVCGEEIDCSQWPQRNSFPCWCLSRALLVQLQPVPSVMNEDRGHHITNMAIRMKWPLPPMPAPPPQSQVLSCFVLC